MPVRHLDRRRRQLASDERAGRYARRRYREAYRSYLLLHWKLPCVGAGLMVGATAIVAVIVHGALLRGIVIGFGLTASIAALAHFVVLASGAGPLIMGELAEQWTARELRRLPGGGWKVVNHFGLARGDIDHVVVGSPGVFVIETKWSALSWTDDWRSPTSRRRVGRPSGRRGSSPCGSRTSDSVSLRRGRWSRSGEPEPRTLPKHSIGRRCWRGRTLRSGSSPSV